ncbi:MAG TPA: hypothetical protein VMH91_01360 [Candidatus Paceibacterota bacterium]|nr:hypothetical protein [Candidatus Paceibacterota bacterium]
MSVARRFTFESYSLDTDQSVITFTYLVEFEGGHQARYDDRLEFPGTTRTMWERIPKPVLSQLLQSLTILHGSAYWKLDHAGELVIRGFSLTRAQADFWNEVYTKGFGEFFYRSNIDHRGLVSFPYRTRWWSGPLSTRFKRSPRTLLLNGGGKDTVVSAEMLKEASIGFDLFTLANVGAKKRVAEHIGTRNITVKRRVDPAAARTAQRMNVAPGGLFTLTLGFQALLAATLWDYRYVVFSNEQSADIGNTKYLGLDVNHQWTKSREAEELTRKYVRTFITPDVEVFSLLRQFTEIETTRRFSLYSKYFDAFCSCNMNSHVSPDEQENAPRSGWCGKCAKCIFIFAGLTAFLPKETVVGIFGRNLYQDTALLPVFRQLLGLQGIKPFECVGTSEEMLVAMHRAAQTGLYDTDPAMDMFLKEIPRTIPFDDIEHRVLSTHGESTVPTEFKAMMGLVS